MYYTRKLCLKFCLICCHFVSKEKETKLSVVWRASSLFAQDDQRILESCLCGNDNVTSLRAYLKLMAKPPARAMSRVSVSAAVTCLRVMV